MKYSIIVAHDLNRGIGKDGTIPWHLPSDMKRFRQITTKNTVVMGRKTWQSLKAPLPNRVNIVLSHNKIAVPEDVYLVHSYEELDDTLKMLSATNVFFIGGSSIYQRAMQRYPISDMHITKIFSSFSCDTFFPETRALEMIGFEMHEENGLTYSYTLSTIKRYSRDEENYLTLLRRVIAEGSYHNDRTGIGTLSIFGDCHLTFNLERGFPLLTTKRVYWRGVVEELLFFLRGDTNNKHLLEKKVGIWTANSSREYLDKIGLYYRHEGDLGPVYGWQWRHFGATYIDSGNTNYEGLGYDQLAEVVRQLREDRSSRRIIMSAWNPPDLAEMCLPPCHVLYQFHVEGDRLSCCMYQRSADLFLGAPFNIASTALLTHLLAKSCELIASRVTIYYGDAHIYLNHLKQVKEQLTREPLSPPILEIRVKRDKVEEYTFEDICLQDYQSHPEIKAIMAV